MDCFTSITRWFPGYFAGILLFSATAASGGEGVPKTFVEFEKSASAGAKVPSGLSEPLSALWYVKAGQWERAHEIAQDIETKTGSWIHAFLHREEGDLPNAGYWYRRAGMTKPDDLEIAEEWSQIARELWQREKGTTPGQEMLTSTSGLVATTAEASTPEEGAWDTVIRKNRETLLRIENARPVSFSPSGDVLLMIDSAADDHCRHFLIQPSANAKIPPFGKRISVGGRFVTKHEWSEDGSSLTMIPDPKLSDAKPETISVAEHLTSK